MGLIGSHIAAEPSSDEAQLTSTQMSPSQARDDALLPGAEFQVEMGPQLNDPRPTAVLNGAMLCDAVGQRPQMQAGAMPPKAAEQDFCFQEESNTMPTARAALDHTHDDGSRPIGSPPLHPRPQSEEPHEDGASGDGSPQPQPQPVGGAHDLYEPDPDSQEQVNGDRSGDGAPDGSSREQFLLQLQRQQIIDSAQMLPGRADLLITDLLDHR